MMQSEVNDPVIKTYKSGTTLYRYSFALLMRMDNSDTATRLNNQRELAAITSAMLANEWNLTGFKVWQMEQDTTPRVIETEEGKDVCLVTLHIDYMKGE